MADITTDVLIVGTGPAGSATAALLSTYGVENFVINRYRWLANTPRAHITNQRTMEVLRDLGREVEAEAIMHATEQDLMGENVFCTSSPARRLGRMKSWGKHPLSRAEHQLSSPCAHERSAADLHGAAAVQDRLLARHAVAHVDASTCRHVQDADGVTVDLPRPADRQGLHRALQISGRRRRRQFAGRRACRPAVRRQDGRRRLDEHPVPRRPFAIRRAPPLACSTG